MGSGPTFVNDKKMKIDSDMKTMVLIREIYLEGFRNLGHFLLKNYLKAFAWFSFALFLITLYAFVFRVSTGYAFD
jgi:hypothetical protein